MPSSRLVTVAKATGALGLTRVFTILLPLITLPFALDYLGPERFGMYMTFIGLTAVLTLGEGGISSALLTTASRAVGANDDDALLDQYNSALLAVLPMASFLLLIGMIGSIFIDWSRVLGLSGGLAAREAPFLFLMIAWGTALVFWANITIRLRHALNETPYVAIWDIVGSVAAIACFFAMIQLDLGTVGIAFAIYLVPILARLVGVVCFLATRPNFRPALHRATLDQAKQLFIVGAGFLVVGASAGLSSATDLLIISNELGAAAVSDFAILLKLYAQPLVLVGLFQFALWPHYSAALAQKDVGWIARSFGAGLALSVIFGALVSGILFVLQKPLLDLWMGDLVRPSNLLSGQMALHGVIIIACAAFQTLFLSIDLWRVQMMLSCLMVSLNIPLTYYLVPIMGPEGAIVASNIVLVGFVLLPSALLAARYFWHERAVVPAAPSNTKEL